MTLLENDLNLICALPVLLFVSHLYSGHLFKHITPHLRNIITYPPPHGSDPILTSCLHFFNDLTLTNILQLWRLFSTGPAEHSWK